MRVEKVEEKNVWENFLKNCKEKTFLNSWNWGNFQEKMGNKIWKLGVFEKELISVALVIKVEAKRGTFLFLPHCPNIKENFENKKFEILKKFLFEIKKIAKKEKADFIRIAPIFERKKENLQVFKKLGFREAPIHIHPENSWELNIDLPEEKLLMQMRKTTRYLIRKAQKEKIEIFEKNDLEGLKEFEKLYQITRKRHHFVPFSFDYLKNEFLVFSKENQISILLGKYKGEIVAGGIFIFWQKIGFYHHGASSLKYPKVPVSYLLIWEAIKKAKERGCEKFNFWGIAERDFKYKILKFKIGKHPWQGLTLFKKGFGGEEKKYVKTQDLPLKSKYWFNFIVEKIRKIKRGL